MKHEKHMSLVVLLFIASASVSIADEAGLIEQMKNGNAVLMIRHALAPGTGDPVEFELNDCSTQRNLNETGREQAREIGQWLRVRGIDNVTIYSSQWCRCLETARLMDLGVVTPLPALNSFFGRPLDREPNLSALRKFIRNNTRPGELIVMVTHQVTISGITNEWTDSGEGKLIQPRKDGGIELISAVNFE